MTSITNYHCRAAGIGLEETRHAMTRRQTDPPRGVLKMDAADATRLRHERFLSSDDMAPYVDHYWVVEWDFRGRAPHRAETLPHPNVHMVFEASGRSRIGGPATAKFSRVLDGQGAVFAVKFAPAGFQAFARGPVARFANRIVTLRHVFGREADALVDAIDAAGNDAARIAIVERFLRARRPNPDEHVQQLNRIVATVAADRDILRVDDLVDRFGLNKRMLQRLFARYVGVSPKWIIQRYRLHEAAERLAQDGTHGHASLALQLGYSDQAHFVRDFKAIVGVSPAAYARAAKRS
jgi:AraC-like DNA-binding protein